MAQPNSPGLFCWVELGTTDASAAKSFYGDLFGWKPLDIPMGPSGVYTILQLNGKDAGALYELSPEQRQQGIPSHWLSYIASSDAGATAVRIKELGGTIIREPTDAGENGRLVIAKDVTGAVFAVWQAKSHVGATAGTVNGTHCWTELVTTDAAGATDFYAKLFGYDANVMPMGTMNYTMLMKDGAPAGGIFQMTKEMQGVPSHWMVYFRVNDADDLVLQAKGLGANILVPPTDIPTVGRFSTLTDPQGAAFSIIRLSAGAAA